MPEKKEKIIIEADSEQFEEDGLKKKTIRVLSFKIGSENYCVDIRQAKEVVEVRQVTRVPNSPGFIVGVMNLRGDVIALIDIRYFFGLEQKERTKDARVLVTDITGDSIGIVVDKASDTIDIEEEKIEPPLATLKGKFIEFTKGQIQLGDDMLILLDLEKVLRSDEMEKFKKGERT